MSLLLALMLAQAGAPAAGDQIVVMAQRIRSIEASVGQDQTGAWRCSLSASSGSERVDGLLCRTATECSQRPGNDREELGQCIEQRRPGIIEDFRRNLARGRGR